MPRGRCWDWYGFGPYPGYGGAGPAPRGPAGGWGLGLGRGWGLGLGRGWGLGLGRGWGLGWLAYDSLREGPKTAKEVADWITSKSQTQLLADYITPLLDWWATIGIAKKDSEGKYSLSNTNPPFWWGWPHP